VNDILIPLVSASLRRKILLKSASIKVTSRLRGRFGRASRTVVMDELAKHLRKPSVQKRMNQRWFKLTRMTHD